MAKGATSLAELQSQIEEALSDSLSGDISDFIKRRLVAHAGSDVYDVYTPEMYGRRGSLVNEELYVDYMVKTAGISRLVITPMQSFNPHIMIKQGYNKWVPATSKNSGNELAGLVNYGDTAYKGYSYDFYEGNQEGDASYAAPRPFLDNTVEELENGELGDQLWVSLKKRGFNVK